MPAFVALCELDLVLGIRELCNNSATMDTPNTITIQLDDREYKHLEAAARSKGMAPDVLVRSLVDDAIRDEILNDPERRKQAMSDALDALDKLAARMPAFDAEKLIREGREELEERPIS